MRDISFYCLAILAVLMAGCSGSDAGGALPAREPADSLVIGFLPPTNPQDFVETATAFCKLLAQQLGCTIRPFQATDYYAAIEGLRTGKCDCAFLNQIGLAVGADRAQIEPVVTAVREGNATLRSVALVRADSAVTELAGLKAKRVGFVDPLSTTGYILPMHLLIQEGCVTDRDPASFFSESTFIGDHKLVLLALLRGDIDVGFTFEAATSVFLTDRDRPKLRILAYTASVPNECIAVRKGLAPELQERLADVLLRFHETDAGRQSLKALSVDSFVSSSMADYQELVSICRELGTI